MKKMMIRIADAAAVAALLLLGATGCSKFNVQSEEVPAVSSRYAVSVGANMPGTRSTGVLANGTWTLAFTSTDQLFISGAIEDTENLYLAGTLSVVPGSLVEGNLTHAEFAGELTVYEEKEVIIGYEEYWDTNPDNPNYNPELGGCLVEDPDSPIFETVYEEASYDLSDYDNPLQACDIVHIQLIPSGDWSDFEHNEVSAWLPTQKAVAGSVEELMEKCVAVQGYYDFDENKIILDDTYPILDITVSGLTAGADYRIGMYYSVNGTDVNDDDTWLDFDLDEARTASSKGVLHFAINMHNNWVYDEERDESVPANLFLKLEEAFNKTYTVLLGRKDLEAKVYTVNRTAVADPSDPTMPVVSGSYTYDFDRGFYVSESESCTVRGFGYNVLFDISYDGTICLNNAELTRDDWTSAISGDNFNLNLQGTNSISGDAMYVISGNAITVTGNGTLKITSSYGLSDKYKEDYRLKAGKNHTLTYSGLTDNKDDTYTFTVTVAPTT